MSLRDQLLAKGLVSKADKARVERELKAKRKAEQGERARASEIEAMAARRAEEERARLEAERIAQRRELDAAAAARERVHQLRQIVRNNRLGWRGAVPYHYRESGGTRVHRIDVLPGVAQRLRCGEAAIVSDPEHPERHLVVQPHAARRLRELGAGHLVVAFHEDTAGLSDPAERVVSTYEERPWDPRPHRVRRPGGSVPETPDATDP